MRHMPSLLEIESLISHGLATNLTADVTANTARSRLINSRQAKFRSTFNVTDRKGFARLQDLPRMHTLHAVAALSINDVHCILPQLDVACNERCFDFALPLIISHIL